jgi:hypothetical protein
MELEAKGMNSKDAAKQAYSELHPDSKQQVPTLDKSTNLTENKVPIDTTSTDKDKEIENLLKKINETLEKIEEGSKKTQTVSNSGRRSGYDAYNLRDPLLASLNTGTLDLS